MRTYLRLIRRNVSQTLAAVAIAAVASVSAQTVINPDLKAPPGAYDPSSKGMILRGHQIAGVRSPGDQNSIGLVLKQLAGGFGPSLSGATNGPLAGGLWSGVYLNHAIDPAWPVDGDGDWWFFGAPVLPFPGVNADTNQTGSVSTFAYEIITYLDLPAGTSTLAVGSGDSFRLSIGVGDNPYSFAAVTPGLYGATRNYAVTTFDLSVTSAGVYPVRIIYGQGGGTAGLQFFSVVDGTRYLINDPDAPGVALAAYRPAALPIAPSQAYLSLLSPVPGETGVGPQPTVVVQLTDGTATTVNPNTISMSFDGGSVSPTITQNGKVTTATYTVPGTLVGLSTHTATVVAQDSAANVLSNEWSFTVGSFTVVPASWAYPTGSGDATQPGFAGRIHQLRANAFISTSIATANAQLAGEMLDPNTAEPYINMVVTRDNPIVGAGWSGTQPADAGGAAGESRTFTQTQVVNYSIADGFGGLADIGEFNNLNGEPESLWPGLPGSTDSTFAIYENALEFATEFIGWIALPAGLQEIGVNCDDGFQLAISPNDARDLFRKDLMNSERDRGATTSRVTLFVETSGVYSFRLIYRTFRDTVPNALEWFRYDPLNPNQPVLINDTGAGAVKSYRAVTVPTRPYVKSVTPVAGASGVGPTAPVNVVLVNLGAHKPVLKVAGASVAYTSVTNGNEVTLTYTPTTPLSGVVNCEVTYAGAVGQWSYAVRTGRKAMLVINGSSPNSSEQAIAKRLAVTHGLDVEIKDSSLFGADAGTLSLATDKALIVVSSTISSGSMQSWARAFVTANTAVPVMTWEYGNVDDWAFNTDGGNGNAGTGQTSVLVTNAPNALTADLTNGVHAPYVSSSGQSWMTSVPDGAIVAGTGTDGSNPRIVGIPSGLTVDPTPFGASITHASRKVYWGLIHNTGAEVLNEAGLTLFDAAVSWLVPPPPTPPKLTATAGPGVGQLTLSWTSSGTLETAASLTAPVWGAAPSQSNPQTVSATDPQRYYRVRQ